MFWQLGKEAEEAQPNRSFMHWRQNDIFAAQGYFEHEQAFA
jgi:hypothetical protein